MASRPSGSAWRFAWGANANLKLAWIAAAVVSLLAAPAAEAKASAATTTRIERIERVVADNAGSPYDVRFQDGLYSSSSGDIYLDGDGNHVYRLDDAHLVPAPDESDGAAMQPMESCGGGRKHCEHNHCQVENST